MNALRIILLHLRIAVLNELQYRTNFGLQLFQSGVALATSLVGIGFIYSKTDTLDGWTAAHLLIVVGVYFLVGGLVGLFVMPSLGRFMEEVRVGALDFALLKPIDSQLLITTRSVEPWKVVDVAIGLTMIAVAVWQTGEQISLAEATMFSIVLVAGCVIVTAFLTILATTAFWLVRVSNILVIYQSLFEAGRWPITIYPGWLQVSLTFLVPVGFAITAPAAALTSRLDYRLAIVAVLLAVAMTLFARWFWRRGLRNYAGASA